MRAVRIFLALACIAVAITVTWPMVIEPCILETQKKESDRRTRDAVRASEANRPYVAIENVAFISDVAERFPEDTSTRMLLAANYRLMGRPEMAIPVYEALLRSDPRVEIYLNLGDTFLELARPAEAVAPYVAACRFDAKTLEAIPDSTVRLQVAERLAMEE